MNRIDPESFKGKVWLLIVDKIIIGLILAIAFLIYDNIKTKEVRTYNESREEIQLSIKQAEMKKQFLPIVLDTSKNVRERVHSLISLVQTKSIDAYGAIDLAGDILEESNQDSVSGLLEWEYLPDLRYLKYELYEISSVALPNLLERYLTEYSYHLKDYESSLSGNMTLRLAKNAETAFWIRLLRYALDKDPNAFEKLNDKLFLIKHLETFDAITPTISKENAAIWAQSKILGLRVLGTLELHSTRTENPNDTKFIIQQLKKSNDEIDCELNKILFKMIHERVIISEEFAKTAYQIMKRQEKYIEQRNVHFEKHDPKKELFYGASKYLIWSCAFAQIDSTMESIILPEIEDFIMSLPEKANPNIEYVNSTYMRQLIESRIISNSAQGREPSPLSKAVLSKLFNKDERILDAYNLLELKEKWKE